MAALTRIVILDDHPVVAQGTANVLVGGGMDVVGISHAVEDGIRLIAATSPDVVVSDVMFGHEPLGLSLPSRLRSLGIVAGVLLLSSFEAPYFLARAFQDGAAGYVSKSAPVAELLGAVRAVAEGRVAFSAQALRLATSHKAPTPRETEVISLVATGVANGEIALRMRITERTVESYLAELFARYGLTSRTQLAMYAVEQGWLPSQALSPRTR